MKQSLPNSEMLAHLVTAYVDLVYAAALRQVRDPHLADDVTQAVFLVVTRKIDRLPEEALRPGWLLKATRYTALMALRADRRRKRNEFAAGLKAEKRDGNSKELQFEAVLDEAMMSLSETDRQLVVQRFMQGRSIREIAATLSLREKTAAKRLERALARMRHYFERRGVKLTEAAVGAAIPAISFKAAPAGLAGAIVHAGASGAAASVPLVGSSVPIGVWLMTMPVGAKVAAGVVIAALAVGGTYATVKGVSAAQGTAETEKIPTPQHPALLAEDLFLNQRINGANAIEQTFPQPSPTPPTLVRPDVLALRDASPVRKVQFVMDTPPGYAPLKGTLTVCYSLNNTPTRTAATPLGTTELRIPAEVTNSVATVFLPTPSTLDTRNWPSLCNVAGYYIESPPASQLSISSGPDILEIHLHARPAGLVHGHLVNASGAAATLHADDFIQIVRDMPQDPPMDLSTAKVRHAPNLLLSPRISADRFAFAPVPFADSCIIIAQIGNEGIALSDSFTLSDKSPIQEIALHLPKDLKETSVKILRPNGEPLRDTAQLIWRSPWGDFRLRSIAATPDGRYMVNLPPSLPGICVVRTAMGQGYPAQNIVVTPGDSKTVSLVMGFSLRGTIIDKSTGRPIALHTVNVLPEVPGAPGSQVGSTDGNGKFSFDGLLEGNYQIQMLDYYVEDATVINAPDGKSHWITYPAGYKTKRYPAGSGEEIVIQLVPKPDTPLSRAATRPRSP